jgi:hypothetical protein
LANYPQCDEEVRRLADELWGNCDGKTVREHAFGKGRMIWGRPLAAVMADLGVARDFEFHASRPDVILRAIHRTDEGTDGRAAGGRDIYFVCNQRVRAESAECLFRVSGKAPELWHPDTGQIERPAVYAEKDGRISMPLHFDPKGSVFVVFREKARRAPLLGVTRAGRQLFQPAGETTPLEVTMTRHGVQLLAWEAGDYELATPSGKPVKALVAGVPAPIALEGPWELHFPPKQGAPEKITLDKLASWTALADQGVNYFSGTATYLKEFDLPVEMLGQDKALYLDLGQVKNLAEVKLNGQDLGVLWKPPFQVEISHSARPGRNRLEVRVTNLWVNRLIGDERIPPEKRFTWTNLRIFYKADSPLLESGLLGPLTIRAAVKREVSF